MHIVHDNAPYADQEPDYRMSLAPERTYRLTSGLHARCLPVASQSSERKPMLARALAAL